MPGFQIGCRGGWRERSRLGSTPRPTDQWLVTNSAPTLIELTPVPQSALHSSHPEWQAQVRRSGATTVGHSVANGTVVVSAFHMTSTCRNANIVIFPREIGKRKKKPSSCVNRKRSSKNISTVLLVLKMKLPDVYFKFVVKWVELNKKSLVYHENDLNSCSYFSEFAKMAHIDFQSLKRLVNVVCAMEHNLQ